MHLDADDSVAVWLQDPPIPGNPCRYDKKLVVPGSDKGFFNATTGRAPSVSVCVCVCVGGGGSTRSSAG